MVVLDASAWIETAKSSRRMKMFLSSDDDAIKDIGLGCFISKASMSLKGESKPATTGSEQN
jgi:hypothetical protein